MTDDVDIRSGGLVSVDTDSLRHVAGVLTALAARLGEAAGVLGAAGDASLAAGLWVPSPQASAQRAEDVADDLARGLRTLAEVYELAEQQALVSLGGERASGSLQMLLAARRLQATPDVSAAATRLATAWMQSRHGEIERQMQGAAGMPGPVGPLGPVGPALTTLTAAVRAVHLGIIPADAPPLRPIGAAASVIELSRHQASGPEAAPTSLVDIIDRMPGRDGNDEARVRVEEYRFASGESQFVVYIDGTRKLIDADEPWDMGSNLQLYFGEESSSYVAVERALAAAGAVSGDRLHIVGYSQGGMIAAHLARQGGFDVATQIGIASPVQPVLSGDTFTVGLRHTDDPVAALSVGGIPGVSGARDSFVVERVADPTPNWSDVTFSVHGLAEYRETAALADASGDPRVAALRDHLAPLAGAAMVTSTVYGAHRAAPPERRRRGSGGE